MDLIIRSPTPTLIADFFCGRLRNVVLNKKAINFPSFYRLESSSFENHTQA
jgi:hypothetical protein